MSKDSKPNVVDRYFDYMVSRSIIEWIRDRKAKSTDAINEQTHRILKQDPKDPTGVDK